MSAIETPDVAGFVAADKRLRQFFGDTITFRVPQEPQWPVGTKINPDTGEPYNAMAVRANVEFADVQVVVLVILKEASPLRPQADVQWTEVGLMSGMDIILDVDADDYDTVKDATEFSYVSKNYRAEEWKPFEVANTTYRWLCYGKER